MAPTVIDPKTANIWTARIIPIVLAGLVGYVTWVFVVLVCVNYLLKTSGTDPTPRTHVAVALIVVYSILLLLVALSYFRLLYTVTRNPGFVPRGPKWQANNGRRESTRQRHRKRQLQHGGLSEQPVDAADPGYELNGSTAYPDRPPVHEDVRSEQTASNLKDFYNKEVFSCEGGGRPIWCSTCLNFKPDRAHHCREVGRCVRKMDHFCPWVGGVVSETSFKFFLQFIIWASVYWVYNLITMAIFVAEMKKENNQFNIHWILTLAFGGFFGLFTLGMTLSSMQSVFLNTTTIENLSRRTKVWTLAIQIPRNARIPTPPPFNTITYPLGYMHPNQNETQPQTSPPVERTFAILHSKPGENPWDLGCVRNFKSVMGENWYDWLLPLRYSPCCDHEKYEAHFKTGPVVQRMKEDAGLVPQSFRYDNEKPQRRRRRRQRRRQNEDNGKAAREGHGRRHQTHGPEEGSNGSGAGSRDSTIA